MTRYTNFKMRISEGQKDKLKKAFESNCESITIRLAFSDLHGEDVIALTNSQLDRLVKAYEEKKGMTIRMSKTQISPQHENRRKIFTGVSRIDSFLTGTVLPALGVGVYQDWRAGEYKNYLETDRFLRREVVCVRLKLMGKGCT